MLKRKAYQGWRIRRYKTAGTSRQRARRSGKTTLVRQFAAKTAISPRRGELLRQQDCQRDGHEGDRADDLLLRLSGMAEELEAGKTLVFLDG